MDEDMVLNLSQMDTYGYDGGDPACKRKEEVNRLLRLMITEGED